MKRTTRAAALVTSFILTREVAAGPAGTLECPNSDDGLRLIDLAKNSPEAAIASLTTLYGTPQSQIRDSHHVTLTWQRTKTAEAPASWVVLTLGFAGDQPYECNSGWSLK